MNSKDCPMRATCKDRFRKGESACAKCSGPGLVCEAVHNGLVCDNPDSGVAIYRGGPVAANEDSDADWMSPDCADEDGPEPGLTTYEVNVTFDQMRHACKTYVVKAVDAEDAENQAEDLAHDDAEEGDVDWDDYDNIDYDVGDIEEQ